MRDESFFQIFASLKLIYHMMVLVSTQQSENDVNADNLVVTVKDCVVTDFFFWELLV